MKHPHIARALLAVVALGLALATAEGLSRLWMHYQMRRAKQAILESERWALARRDESRRTGLKGLIRPSPNPLIIYELIPNQHVRYLYGSTVDTNSAGFRAMEETTTAKPPSTFRILGIGDSIMFGHGVSNDETFLAVLGRMLNVETINTAVPGYNSTMEVETFKAKGVQYGPDLLIHSFCGNDDELPYFVPVPADWHAGLSRSALASLARSALIRPGDLSPDGLPPWHAKMRGWGCVEAALTELAQVTRQRGIPVVTLLHYTIVKATAAPEDHRGDANERMIALARTLGFAIVDPYMSVAAYCRARGWTDSRALCVSPRDGDVHPSPEHHRLLAEELCATLLRLRLAAPPAPLPP